VGLANLKLWNVVAMALVALAYFERRRRASRRGALGLAACIDGGIMWTLMMGRHAATVATHLPMTPARLAHIGTSTLFMVLYPFVLFGEADEAATGNGRLATRLLTFFVLVRAVSFLTSYSMTGG